METIAYYTFWVGAISTFLALVVGLAHSLLPQVAVRNAATNNGSMVVPVLATEPASMKGASQGMAWLAIATFAVYLGVRWGASGLPPISNMWEYTVAFGLALIIGSRWVDWRYRTWGFSLAFLAAALVLFSVAEAAFSAQITFTPAPHLQHIEASHLLVLHAGPMVVAFGAFAVAFVSAGAILYWRVAGPAEWFPSRPILGEIMDRAVVLGFFFYTFGLAIGSFWMNSLWGKYWDWDTKASSALTAWLIYVAYLHARNLPGWRNVWAPLLVIAGFAMLMFGYFVVNLFDYFAYYPT